MSRGHRATAWIWSVGAATALGVAVVSLGIATLVRYATRQEHVELSVQCVPRSRADAPAATCLRGAALKCWKVTLCDDGYTVKVFHRLRGVHQGWRPRDTFTFQEHPASQLWYTENHVWVWRASAKRLYHYPTGREWEVVQGPLEWTQAHVTGGQGPCIALLDQQQDRVFVVRPHASSTSHAPFAVRLPGVQLVWSLPEGHTILFTRENLVVVWYDEFSGLREMLRAPLEPHMKTTLGTWSEPRTSHLSLASKTWEWSTNDSEQHHHLWHLQRSFVSS